MVANPSCGQLNREVGFAVSPFTPENLVSRDRFDRPVPSRPLILHTQAESDADYCTCLLYNNNGCWKREAYIDWCMM